MTCTDHENITKTEVSLREGLVGLPEFRRFALLRQKDAFPFVRLCSHDHPAVEFLAIEPAGWVKDYSVELTDAEAARLQLGGDAAEALVLTIVTVRREEPKLTLNLLAPLVINRASGEGKQVVQGDAKRYSTAFPLTASVS